MNERFRRAQRYSTISRGMSHILHLLGNDAAEKITPHAKQDSKSKKNIIALDPIDKILVVMYSTALKLYRKS